MNLIERENTEWTNSWISKANVCCKRCLLIGDSTTRQIRSSLEFLALGFWVVDLVAASYAVWDDKFIKYLRFYFDGDEYTYEMIFLQYGGHHNFVHKCCESEADKSLYYKEYKNIVNFLKEKCKNIIILSSTDEALGSVNRKELISRNDIARDVAKELNCKFYDVYELMKKSEYIHTDMCHYQREADGYISYHLLLFLEREGVITTASKEKICEENKRKIQNYSRNNPIFIYGKGIRGQEIYWFLKWNGIETQIGYFVESNITSEKIFDIPIIGVVDIKEEDKHNLLIVSSEKYEDEMRKKAEEYEFKNVITQKEFVKMMKR